VSAAAWFLIVAFVALTWWVVTKALRYRRLYADGHLMELARGLEALRAAPGTREVREEGLVPHFITSAGLIVAYSWRPDGSDFVHHLSLSHQRGPIAQGAASTLLAFSLDLLGVDLASAQSGTSARLVTHAAFRLTAAEQAALVGRSAIVVHPAHARERLAQALRRRR
jgi:hypothetical protein